MLWQGGFYGSPSVAGSRPGAIIAGTWAAVCKIGRQGYTKFVKDILSAQRNIIKKLKEEVPEVEVATKDVSSIVSIVTRKEKGSINCIALADILHKDFKWYCNKIMRPTGFHIALTEGNCCVWEKFVDDIKAC